VKTWMDSTTPGLVARTIVVDVTTPAGKQSGPKSRRVSLAPTKQEQEGWARYVKLLPATPVVGNVIIRAADHSVEGLNSDLGNTHAHKRAVMVPIRVPEEFLRYVRGGTRRASGPRDDDTTGVDFIMRTVGRRHMEKGDKMESSVPAVPDESVADDEEHSADELDESEVAGRALTEMDKRFLEMVDPALMTPAQLRAVFGNKAADINGIYFQHSARITNVADYLPRTAAFLFRSSDRAETRRYRKGQLHTSVWVRVLKSALTSSNVELSANECLVILTGGTPEVAVAGIVCGYRRVFVTCEPAEQIMYQMPSVEAERESNVNYHEQPACVKQFASHGFQCASFPRSTERMNTSPVQLSRARYVSPDPENPSKGVLAAAAVRMLAPYVTNAIHGNADGEKAAPSRRAEGCFASECETSIRQRLTGRWRRRRP
jgi:hypothetical protein